MTQRRMVFKYELELISVQRIVMPKGSQILSVGVQRDKIMLWALVYLPAQGRSQINVFRAIRIVGTGEGFDAKISEVVAPSATDLFIGTVFQDTFVWHIFDLGERHA